jgi:tRNA threonylcarbamoyladenosine biosynthesis protein TsaB
MRFLALDTSSERLCLALFDGPDLVAEQSEKAIMRQSERLVPSADSLLKSQGWRPADLAALAVGLGPGSFTGLRVGLAFAKGLSLGLGLKVLGIPSLLARAEAAKAEPGRNVTVLLDGRREWVFRGSYRLDPAGWQETLPAGLVTLEEALKDLNADSLVTGDLPETRPDWAEAVSGLDWAPADLRQVSATALGRLAWPRLERGEKDDPALLEPLYLKKPEAEIRWSAKKD